jgi:tRNA-dihydrouridine synthase
MESRKHMAMYIKGIRGAADFRQRLVRIENLEELHSIVHDIEQAIKTVKVGL